MSSPPRGGQGDIFRAGPTEAFTRQNYGPPMWSCCHHVSLSLPKNVAHPPSPCVLSISLSLCLSLSLSLSPLLPSGWLAGGLILLCLSLPPLGAPPAPPPGRLWTRRAATWRRAGGTAGRFDASHERLDLLSLVPRTDYLLAVVVHCFIYIYIILFCFICICILFLFYFIL